MHDTSLFAHPFCSPDMLEIMEQSAVKEIAPDVWLIQGCLGFAFFIAPPSSNVYVLRDGDNVIVLDTGMHPFYQSRILAILEKFKAQGAKNLILMVTQGHWDHAMNNDVILKAGYDNVRFLLPEPELPVIEYTYHWLNDLRRLESFYNPYGDWVGMIKAFDNFAEQFDAYNDPQYRPVWEAVHALNEESDKRQFRLTLKLLCDRVFMANTRNMAEMADVLSLDERDSRLYGDAEVKGWQVGRFFVIHDGGHSPGHISLYDPENKLLLTGDATIEINPAFFDSSLKGCIDAVLAFRRMTEAGLVELVGDAHRNETMFPEAFAAAGMEALDKTQLVDMVTGREECLSFFKTMETFYRTLQQETLLAHARLGEASVPQITEELFKSESKFIQFKKAFPFPSRPELLTAVVLNESGASRRREGEEILFSPAVCWKI